MVVFGKLNVSGARWGNVAVDSGDIAYVTAVNGALRVTPKMLLL